MSDFKEKFVNKLSSRGFMVFLSFLGLYLLSTGTSWAIFSYLRGEPDLGLGTGMEGTRARIADLPKTEECPINGGRFTEVEREIWESRRPIAAIIENHLESRPPSGLSFADVIYEAVAEGGITRFLSIFYCGAAASDVKIAPVRSARVYYIDWAAEYGDKPIFMHVGGANDYAGYGDTTKAARALELLTTLGWRVARGNDLDTTFDSGFPILYRNYERLAPEVTGEEIAKEHTMMASLDAAYEEAKKRGFTNKDEDGVSWDADFTPWKFTDGDADSSPEAGEISFEFWSGFADSADYSVTWKYDSSANAYLRENGGKLYVDLETDQQIKATNVVIQFTKERRAVDRNKHLLYTTIGSGRALIFQNGRVVEGTWNKDSRLSRTEFFDKGGSEISFVRGPIWIEVVPAGNEIEY